MVGRRYFAIPKHGAAQPFLTPFQAMRALDDAGVEGDIWTEDSGHRVFVGHRTAAGEWTY